MILFCIYKQKLFVWFPNADLTISVATFQQCNCHQNVKLLHVIRKVKIILGIFRKLSFKVRCSTLLFSEMCIFRDWSKNYCTDMDFSLTKLLLKRSQNSHISMSGPRALHSTHKTEKYPFVTAFCYEACGKLAHV